MSQKFAPTYSLHDGRTTLCSLKKGKIAYEIFYQAICLNIPFLATDLTSEHILYKHENGSGSKLYTLYSSSLPINF